MSVEKETLRRVQDALNFHLRPAIAGFVEQNMKTRHGTNWTHFASRAGGSSPNEPMDVYALLKTILDNWGDVFGPRFERKIVHRVRGFASVAFEARNAISHLAIPLQDPEALRYLDAMYELARHIRAPDAEVAALKKLYDEQRRSGVEAPPSPAAPAATGQLALDDDGEPAHRLKPWIEVALPHPDVLANRFKESEFAADLFAVDSGQASEEYATAQAFFGITFLTEGLRRVLVTAMERLTGRGGDPVVGLQTAFGGGKTHTMLAIYHLACSDDLAPLAGISELAEKIGLTGWKRPRVAAFVGTSKGPDTPLLVDGETEIRTLWGYIAWRLAGPAGLAIVAEAEAARTNPGSELMVDVLRLAGPSVILLDELVAYARQLDEDRFEAFLSFIQALTEAAKMVPDALIVGSLPESHAEAGGEKGLAALLRLESVFGRIQSPWLPAAGNETYEIIRRRMFQPLDEEGEKARDETIKAFHDLYKRNAAEFPPECREARYLELLRVSYPIHPELFDRLSKDWASLAKFQRTRGVLRFMANVIGVLWHQQARDPLITPARVPISHERVRASVIYPLDPGFSAVIDKEVDGEGSLAARMESNPSRRISQLRAATRAARAVFICTAPLAGQANAGVTGQGVRLACVEPGEQLAVFGEALRELIERATYLYEETGRYWFSTQPTLNRMAEDLAKGLEPHVVDEAISEVLRKDARHPDRFARVYAAPDQPLVIDEADALSLVILKPEHTHSGRTGAGTPAAEAVTEGLLRCRASQRRHRNTLIFVAPDDAQLATAREAMRRALAWSQIVEDPRVQQTLTPTQATDAKEKARTGHDGAVKAVRTAWSHILYPEKSAAATGGAPFDLEHLSITARDRAGISQAAYEKVSVDGVAKEKLGPDTLSHHLKDLWQDRQHITVAELADWFASYVYLPKIRDRLVLESAIREAAGKLEPTFGYADRFVEASGTYEGFAWRRTPPELMPQSAVIIRADIAAALAEQAQAEPAPTSVGVAERPIVGGSAAGGAKESTKPHRFYGSVDIDMVRPIKAFESIINAVIQELQQSKGARVKLTLEVEAECPEGFSDADVSVVRDNARQLKFKDESTGFGD